MTTLNVLRYVALGSGLVYGFVHVKTLKKQGKKEEATFDLAQEQKLVDEAKKQWQELHPVKQTGKIDWDSKDLDWDKAIEQTLSGLDTAKA